MHEHITYDRLVCGLDDSDHAAAVMAVADALARRLDLRLQAVHAADADLYLVGEHRNAALARGRQLLDEVAAGLARRDKVVGLGEPARLLRAVIDEGAALAVVGSRGRSPARAALFGSTSSELVASAPCPVVVVPPRSGDDVARGPAAVVCGVDGSAGAQDALVIAAELALRLGSELVAVNVQGGAGHMTGSALGPAPWSMPAPVAQRDAGLGIVEGAVARLPVDLPVRMRVELGDPAASLAAVAGQERTAIIVVGTRGHGPVRSALAGSVSSRLCATAPVPVVVVPAGARTPAELAGRRDLELAGATR